MSGQLPEPLPDDAYVKIIHITDLHVGRKFNDDRWNDFSNLCSNLKPDLVIVSGDLVDNPFRWRLRNARDKLYQLRNRVAEAKKGDCRLIVIPGNHDTRITGLIPLARWRALLGLEVLLLAGLGVTGYFRSSFLMIVVAFLALLALDALLFSLFGRFSTYFSSEEAIIKPELLRFGKTMVEIYPFDSASYPIVLAGGEIPSDQFVSSKHKPPVYDPTAPPPYRIAVVHHHPLPIPYDNPLEETMILRNAGALLSELAKLRVRLILHGHKHNWNFARITVNAEQPEPHDIGVLAGTTLARGQRKADGAGYGFNLLVLDMYGNVKVTPYKSKGGTFDAGPEFFVEDIVTCNRRLQGFAREHHGVECGLISSITDITADGDGTRRVEVMGFRVLNDGLEYDAQPGEVMAEALGHIELLTAGPLGQSGPRQLHLRRTVTELRKQGGQLSFGRKIYASDNPFNYFYQYHAINSFAMSEQQFPLMYPKDSGPPIESTYFGTPVFPCRELRMAVHFPQGFQIAGLPELEIIDDQSGRRLNLLERYYRDALQFDRATNWISLNVVAPPPATVFKILWRLTADSPPAGQAIKSLAGLAKELESRLLEVRSGDTVTVDANTWSELSSVVTVLEKSMRNYFKLDPSQRDPLEVSIMVYDRSVNLLRVVLGNFPNDSKGWSLRLAYGNGIAGRAFKMNKIRLFVKAEAEQTGTPYYYYPVEGKTGKDAFPDEVVLAIPLTPSGKPEAVYAVLACSSRTPSSKLVDLDETKAREELDVINKFCFKQLSDLFWPPLTTG
jgi:hypothetical protein